VTHLANTVDDVIRSFDNTRWIFTGVNRWSRRRFGLGKNRSDHSRRGQRSANLQKGAAVDGQIDITFFAFSIHI
jgi:hypothetical protein